MTITPGTRSRTNERVSIRASSMSKSPRHVVAMVVTIETAAVAGNWLITHSRWTIAIAK